MRKVQNKMIREEIIEDISNELNNQYRILVETMDKLSPENWEKLFFLGWIHNNIIEGNFWIKLNDGNIIHASEYLRIFGNNQREEQFKSFVKIMSKMREIFKKYNQELFTKFELVVDKVGKFEVNFSYDKIKSNEYFSEEFSKYKQSIEK